MATAYLRTYTLFYGHTRTYVSFFYLVSGKKSLLEPGFFLLAEKISVERISLWRTEK